MRVIARLDIKNQHVIKGIHLEGLRKVGDPNELARNYYKQGIDEIICMDAVASLYDRNNIFSVVEAASENIFVPITVGGGIRNLDDVEAALNSGADKVAINTAAIKNPELVTQIAEKYGSQCLVGSIEAKKRPSGWEAFIDNGRESTGKDAISWAIELEKLGVGELLITSVDQEGTKRGFDIELIRQINDKVERPIIVCGGFGENVHIDNLLAETQPSAIACASVLHYGICGVNEIKATLKRNGIEVRDV